MPDPEGGTLISPGQRRQRPGFATSSSFGTPTGCDRYALYTGHAPSGRKPRHPYFTEFKRREATSRKMTSENTHPFKLANQEARIGNLKPGGWHALARENGSLPGRVQPWRCLSNHFAARRADDGLAGPLEHHVAPVPAWPAQKSVTAAELACRWFCFATIGSMQLT